MILQLFRDAKILFFLKFEILEFDPCLRKGTLKPFLDHFWTFLKSTGPQLFKTEILRCRISKLGLVWAFGIDIHLQEGTTFPDVVKQQLVFRCHRKLASSLLTVLTRQYCTSPWFQQNLKVGANLQQTFIHVYNNNNNSGFIFHTRTIGVAG